MALVAFFVYWCTSSKFIMQNCHLVEVSGCTYIWFRNATVWSRTPKIDQYSVGNV